MRVVLLTALGVGDATVVGAAPGLISKRISHLFSDITPAFTAGVILCAAVVRLILSSLEHGG